MKIYFAVGKSNFFQNHSFIFGQSERICKIMKLQQLFEDSLLVQIIDELRKNYNNVTSFTFEINLRFKTNCKTFPNMKLKNFSKKCLTYLSSATY